MGSSWQGRGGAARGCPAGGLAANLATCRALAARAAAEGVQLVGLPENFALLGRGEADKLAAAESLEAGGPIGDALREIATRHGVWVVGGGMPERVPGDDKRT